MAYKIGQLANLCNKISINLCILCVGLFLLGCAKENHKETIIKKNQIEIFIQQERGHALTVNYQLKYRVTALDFGPVGPSVTSLSQMPLDWAIKEPDLALTLRDGRLLLISKNGAPFQQATLQASSHQGELVARYRSIYPFDGQEKGTALVLYTGHFWPFTPKGKRMEAVFNFTPLKSASINSDTKTGSPIGPIEPIGYVRVHGEQSTVLTQWQSPIDHPAFVYFGPGVNLDSQSDNGSGAQIPLDDTQPDTISLIFDDEMPDWIKSASTDIARDVHTWLETAFNHRLVVRPSLFVTLRREDLNDDIPTTKGFIFEGDALPGQIMVTLTGEAWETSSAAGRDILNRSLAHEMVHLWQTQIRAALQDGEDRVPSWIHEGAADAIAAEVLVGVGIWDDAAKNRNFNKARAECSNAIAGRTLAALAASGDSKGVYACGHILALLAVSGQDSPQVTHFWQDFIDQTLDSGEGYSLTSWLALVDVQANTPYLASGLKAFIETPSSLPAAEILRLQSLGAEAP